MAGVSGWGAAPGGWGNGSRSRTVPQVAKAVLREKFKGEQVGVRQIGWELLVWQLNCLVVDPDHCSSGG